MYRVWKTIKQLGRWEAACSSSSSVGIWSSRKEVAGRLENWGASSGRHRVQCCAASCQARSAVGFGQTIDKVYHISQMNYSDHLCLFTYVSYKIHCPHR